MKQRTGIPLNDKPQRFATDAQLKQDWDMFRKDTIAEAITALEETEIDGQWFVQDVVTGAQMAGPFNDANGAIQWILAIKIIPGK